MNQPLDSKQCYELCKAQSARCLLINYSKFGNPNALSTLGGQIRRQPPFVINSTTLLNIFGRGADDPAVGLRGATIAYEDYTIANDGAPSRIEVEVGKSLAR